MKKIIMMMGLVGLLLTAANAQKKQSTFMGSAIVGFNACQIDGDDEAGFRKAGLEAGLSVSAMLARRWSLTLEMLYSQKGSSDPTDRDGNGQTLKYSMNYITVPVLLSFWDWAVEDEDGEYMKISATAGPMLQYAIGQKAEINGAQMNDAQIVTYFKDVDLSYTIGANLRFNRHWGMDARFGQSIIPFGKVKDYYHRWLSFRLKYTF